MDLVARKLAEWPILDSILKNFFSSISFDFSGLMAPIAIPNEASSIEFYLLEEVRIQNGCRISYHGTYPSFRCSGSLGESFPYISQISETELLYRYQLSVSDSVLESLHQIKLSRDWMSLGLIRKV